jgi:hypothetical protein
MIVPEYSLISQVWYSENEEEQDLFAKNKH